MVDVSAEIERMAIECAADPVRWANIAYDWGIGELADYNGVRTWQKETLGIIGDHLQNPDTRFQPLKIAVASGHGIGKSALIGMIVNWGLSTCPDTKVLITANTDTQLRTKTSPEVGKWTRLSITSGWFDCQSSSISSLDKPHAKEWRADFVPWSEHNTEAFQGMHNVGKRIILIFDEGSGVADPIWDVGEGALTDENTEIIWIAFSNPTRNTGRFRECFTKYKHRWKIKQIDSREVEGTNLEYLNKLVADNGIDSDFVKVRVRGMFPSMSAKQFISIADVDLAFGKHLRTDQYDFAPVILSCDPAWSGDDELVISKRQGLAFSILRTMPKNDNDMQVANILANLEDEHQADAVFVDGGFGTGIISGGRTLGRNWTIVWFSAEASDNGCLNKRAEMWKEARDWLKAGGAIPKDQVLYDELIGPEIVPRMDGKIQIESKEDMKKRGLPSPNRADSLILTFAYPVASRRVSNPRNKVITDYDPFA